MRYLMQILSGLPWICIFMDIHGYYAAASVIKLSTYMLRLCRIFPSLSCLHFVFSSIHAVESNE